MLSGGSSSLEGGAGASSITSFGDIQAPGGFGGGGGAGDFGGGGGGGFSGGGGGSDNEGGGGGGSFLPATLVDRAILSGVNSGNGYVVIDFVGSAVPEPSTWAMMLAGFARLFYAGCRKAKSGKPAPPA